MLFRHLFFFSCLPIFSTLVNANPISVDNKISDISPHMEIIKRQSTPEDKEDSPFYWPRIDGSLQDAIALLKADPPVLTLGYWTFSTEFDKNFLQIAQSNKTEAILYLFKQMKINQNGWLQRCEEATNQTAKANNRTNTLARIICFPEAQTKQNAIDNYDIAMPVAFGCWEREIGSDPDKPLFDYTFALLKEFKWDEPTASIKAQVIIEALGLNKTQ